MKMKMVTAKDEFDYAVWKILDEIQMQRLLNQNALVIDYYLGIDAKNLALTRFHKVVSFLKNNIILEEVDEPDLCEIGVEGTPEYKVSETYHFKILDSFEDFYRKYTSIVNGEVDLQDLFGFDDQTFWIKLVDGSNGTINFNPTGTREYPTQSYYLLKAFIQLAKSGTFESHSNLVEITLTRKQIIDRIIKLNYPELGRVNAQWISDARNNLVNKSLPRDLQSIIKMSAFDRKSQTYTLSLKIPF